MTILGVPVTWRQVVLTAAILPPVLIGIWLGIATYVVVLGPKT